MFALTACGGGGTGGVKSTPVAAGPSFPLKDSQPFETLSSSRIFTGSGNSLSGEAGVRGRGPFVAISYDASSGTYTLTNDGITSSFGSADRSSSGYFDVYSKQANGVSDELRLFGNARTGGPQAGAPVQLTYLSFGSWAHANSATGETRKYHFVFGYPTASSSMPTTGSATYQTMVSGSMLEAGVGYPNTQNDVSGTATFSANFGAGTVGTELSLARAGSGLSLGNYSGTGTVSGSNQFQGTFTSNAQYFSSGAFMGGFFGPSAAEMGYSFYIYKNNPDPYAGASVAPQNTYINGVVVGKKN